MKLLAIIIVTLQLLPLQGHGQLTGDRAHLNVGSTPAGGYVTVDGKFAGMTPMPTLEVAPGRHLVTVRKEGFITVTDTITVVQGGTVDCRILFEPACELVVESEPAGAAVYIDSRFRGTTPLRLPEMREGRYGVMVSTPKYIRWADSVTIALGSPSSVHARLQPVVGSISVDLSGADHEIFVDAKRVGSGAVSMFSHAMGDVLIGVREPSTGESVSGHFWVPPGGHLRVAAAFRQPTPEVFHYSLLFPGLGQMLSGQMIEGILYAGSFTIAGILVGEAYRTYQDERSKYDAALATYRSANTRASAMEFHQVTQAAYDDIRSARRRTVTLVAIMAGVYAISLADALVFHSEANRIIEIETNHAVPEPGAGVPGSTGVQLSVRIPL